MKKCEFMLNGQCRSFSEGDSLASLMAGMSLGQGALIVEHNGIIVAAENWDRVLLQPADIVEVIHFVGGG